MEEVYIRIIRHGRDILVAVCDAEILGKTLEGGRVPFNVSERFYKGTKGNLEEALEAMSKGTICNIVGKRIVDAAIKKNLVQKSSIIYFGKVPHAQIIIL